MVKCWEFARMCDYNFEVGRRSRVGALEITTNIWNIQGFSKKNQIYLMFLSKSLIIGTNVQPYFRGGELYLPSATCQTRQRHGNETKTVRPNIFDPN